VYTYAIRVTLNYKRTPHIEVAYTSCLASNLNTFISKTPVPNSGILFTYPFINKKLYYNNGLSLNKSINPTNTSL